MGVDADLDVDRPCAGDRRVDGGVDPWTLSVPSLSNAPLPATSSVLPVPSLIVPVLMNFERWAMPCPGRACNHAGEVAKLHKAIFGHGAVDVHVGDRELLWHLWDDRLIADGRVANVQGRRIALALRRHPQGDVGQVEVP